MDGALELSPQQRRALRSRLAGIGTQPGAALSALDMQRSGGVADLARVIEADPALTIRVLSLANSPYYGMAGRIGSAARAVVLLGTSTVTGLAASAAMDLLEGSAPEVPAGYWSHALATAVGAEVVARHTPGVPPGDAFSAGLLHDVGLAIGDGVPGLGTDHAVVGAAALEARGFPAGLVRAVRCHHMAIESAPSRLTQVLIAGQALAAELVKPALDEAQPSRDVAPALGIGTRQWSVMVAEANREADARAAALEVP